MCGTKSYIAPEAASAVVVFAGAALLLGGPLAPFALCRPDEKKAPEHVFVGDTEREVELIRGQDRCLRGKFDAYGNFIPRTEELMPATPTGAVGGPYVSNRMVLTPAQKAAGKQKEDVYEFRSRVLIPGTLDDRGKFTPAIGGDIIPFKDYRYSLEARRIWNLPGYFMRRDDLDRRIKWLRDNAGTDAKLAAEMATLEAAVAGEKKGK
jgi:hypothetical protein